MERGKVVLGCGLLRLIMRVAEQVAEPIGVAHVAAEQRLQRIALEARLVAVLEQLEQAVVRACCAAAAGGLRAAARGKARAAKQQRIRRAGKFHRTDLWNVVKSVAQMQKGRCG